MGTNDTESGQVLSGNGGVPTSSTSQAGVQQSSTVNPELEVALREIETLKQQMKAVQSDKDRGVNKLGKQVDSMKEQLDRYDELLQSGLKPAQARRELQLDALLAEQDVSTSGGYEPNQPAAGNRAAAPGVDLDSIIAQFGLDANDAAVVDVLQKNPAPLAAVGELAKLAQSKKNPITQSPANPGQMMPSGGGRTVTPDIEAEYSKALQGVNRGDSHGLFLLKQQYRKKAKELGVKFEH